MKYWWLYFVLSAAVIIPGTYSLMAHGLKPSIDFTGGTTIVWDVQTGDSTLRQKATDANVEIRDLANKNNVWTIQTSPLSQELYIAFKNSVGVPKELSYDTVGPALGQELIQKPYAILLAASAFFCAYRFKNIKQPRHPRHAPRLTCFTGRV
jgi:preprotein translocase subunit SecF